MSEPMPPLGSYTPAEIPWEEIERRLREAFDYWLVTTRPDGRPHAVPIWGVWRAGGFYFYTEAQTQKVKNLTAQPEVVVHLESTRDVVILEGASARIAEDTEEWRGVAAALFDKYQDPRTGAGLLLDSGPRAPVVFCLRPRHVRA